MRLADGLWAIAVGLIGFGAVELAGRQVGVLTAITRHAWLDAAVHAVATLLVALLFAPSFRRARTWALPLWVAAFVLTFAPVASLLAAVGELTVDGLWGDAALIRSAFVNLPVNLLYALVIDAWFVAVPVGVVGAAVLAWRARLGRRPAR